MKRPDMRKTKTLFIQNTVRNLRKKLTLGAVTAAIPKPRRYQSFDSVNGDVLVVANVSNTRNNRAKAERILGGPVKTLWEDSTGTVWRRDA